MGLSKGLWLLFWKNKPNLLIRILRCYIGYIKWNKRQTCYWIKIKQNSDKKTQ
jgi:hypothetical protein